MSTNPNKPEETAVVKVLTEIKSQLDVFGKLVQPRIAVLPEEPRDPLLDAYFRERRKLSEPKKAEEIAKLQAEQQKKKEEPNVR